MKRRVNWGARIMLAGMGWLVPGFADEALAQFAQSSKFQLSEAVQIGESDSAVQTQLSMVEAFLADQQWDEAVEALRQIMETRAEQVVALKPGHYVTVRDYCHRQISRMPSEALELYRGRVDPTARLMYEEGVERRDAARLEQVIDEAFCSRYGDDALYALGELALEQGRYGAARRFWERISPLLRTPEGQPMWLAVRNMNLEESWDEAAPLLTVRSDPPAWVAYPDTDLDLADVRARLVLVSILEGALQRAAIERDVFRRLHPQAKGRLAGSQVNYADKLGELLGEAAQWPAETPREDWPTFAGSPQRTQPTPPIARLEAAPWKEPISLGQPLSADKAIVRQLRLGRRPAEDIKEAPGLLSYHPLVVGELLVVCSSREIRVFDVESGKPPAWGGADGVAFRDESPRFRSSPHGRSRLGVPRFTMTAYGGKLFARMGEPITGWASDPPPGYRRGYLVCLDLEADGRLMWKAEPGEEKWSFEGSPVCDGANVYVAMRRSDLHAPQAHVACLDARTGERRWRKKICAADTPARGLYDEVTHNLLTLVEETIYYNTNLGTVAALRARDGQIRWIRQYQRAERGDLAQRDAHLYRDLNPCLYFRGTLLVAPSDSERILAMDASTGSLLWASGLPQDVVHLVGVRGEHLVASGDRLWCLNVETGKAVWRFPETTNVEPRGYGRGTIAGDEIFWPTPSEIHVFDATSPTVRQTRTPIRVSPSGNVLIALGHLLVASPDQVDRARTAASEAKPRASTGSTRLRRTTTDSAGRRAPLARTP